MILIFENKARADVLLNEIAVTPFGGVWTWSKIAKEGIDSITGNVVTVLPESTVNDIQYATNEVDDRVAIAHNFSEDDSDWIEAYLQDVSGVVIVDKFLDDWYPARVFKEVIVED